MLLLVLPGFAQGMSDTQVLQYIQREVKAGTSQSQIAVKLMQRGVDMKQIQRVRQLYEKQNGTSATSSPSRTSSAGVITTDSRLRESNGAVRVDAQGDPLYTSYNGYNHRHRRQTTDDRHDRP